MATYYVTVYKNQKYYEEECERYKDKGYSHLPNLRTTLSLDMYDAIGVIKKCEQEGYMVREDLGNKNISDEEIGEILTTNYLHKWKSVWSPVVCNFSSSANEAVGRAMRKHFKSGEKFTIAGACRNDGRFQYYMYFNLESPWIISDILLRDFYKETMKKELTRNMSDSQNVALLSVIPEFVKMPTPEYKEFMQNPREASKYANIAKVTRDAIYTLYVALTNYPSSSMEVYRGKKIRVNASTRVEIALPYLTELHSFIEKNNKYLEELDVMRIAASSTSLDWTSTHSMGLLVDVLNTVKSRLELAMSYIAEEDPLTALRLYGKKAIPNSRVWEFNNSRVANSFSTEEFIKDDEETRIAQVFSYKGTSRRIRRAFARTAAFI